MCKKRPEREVNISQITKDLGCHAKDNGETDWIWRGHWVGVRPPMQQGHQEGVDPAYTWGWKRAMSVQLFST